VADSGNSISGSLGKLGRSAGTLLLAAIAAAAVTTPSPSSPRSG
jgi:hypothetical protein